jgi:hypothetical protein
VGGLSSTYDVTEAICIHARTLAQISRSPCGLGAAGGTAGVHTTSTVNNIHTMITVDQENWCGTLAIFTPQQRQVGVNFAAAALYLRGNSEDLLRPTCHGLNFE